MENVNYSGLSSKAQHDCKLIKAALEKGDQNAYAELLGRYRESVYFMLYKMVRDSADADDLTIEAFAKAFKHLDQYTPNFAFSTWLFRIASNNCIDFIRRKKRNIYSLDSPMQNDEGVELPNTIKADVLDPEEKMIKQQQSTLLREIVIKLKPRYRQLVQFRYFDEMSYEEISVKMDMPIGTVKAQLYRSRELLMNIMRSMKTKMD